MKKAFTLTELSIVMIIVGILATVLALNIRNVKVKEKAMIANSLKTIEAVDQAMTKIREIDKTNCPMGNFIIKQAGKGTYSYELKNNAGTAKADASDVINMIARYMRFEGTIGSFCLKTPYCTNTNIKGAKLAGTDIYVGVEILSDISDCPTYRMPNDATIYPAPTKINKKTNASETAKCWGKLYIDVNGANEPNTLGEDVFEFGLDESGIAR